MQTAEVFEDEFSQAVKIPEEYRFDDDEVYISKVGQVVMLIPKGEKWSGMRKGTDCVL